MESKETYKGHTTSPIFLYNEDYFKYVFKKTEKIVAAVFYTTRSLSDINTSDRVVNLIEDKAQSLLAVVEKTLQTADLGMHRRIEGLHLALVGLESALTVGAGARVLERNVLEVFQNEIALVHRFLKEFDTNLAATEGVFGTERTETPKRRNMQSRTPVSGNAPLQNGVGDISRRDRILAIIREKGHASIKDVSSVIVDCSEKTIQRELMTLISEGQIIKEGERRWSRYSIKAV